MAFRRTRPWGVDLEAVRRLAQAAFSHRRKTLPNSLELAGLADRERSAAALHELGRDPGVRAEALAPSEFHRLSELLA